MYTRVENPRLKQNHILTVHKVILIQQETAKYHLRELACQQADQLATDIASTVDRHKMFMVVRAIKSTKRSDQDGKLIRTD